MTSRLLIRRFAIVAACAFAIAAVVTVVRTAAILRAEAAPLVVAPVSPKQISADLTAELARAGSLSTDLSTLSENTAGMRDALSAAGDQMTADSATAAQLRADLAAASDRLATVRAQLAAAQARLARLVAAANAAAVSRSSVPAGGGGEHEHEGGGDD
jgi:septal ring factor EnvC (AmiA/AmiB activator)